MMKKKIEEWPHHDYATRLSVAVVYAFLAAIAVNFFYQPGHIYSSGATGFAQILTTLSDRVVGFTVPVSITLFLINVPLFFLAWFKIGHKFTIFTFITVTCSFTHPFVQKSISAKYSCCTRWYFFHNYTSCQTGYRPCSQTIHTLPSTEWISPEICMVHPDRCIFCIPGRLLLPSECSPAP